MLVGRVPANESTIHLWCYWLLLVCSPLFIWNIFCYRVYLINTMHSMYSNTFRQVMRYNCLFGERAFVFLVSFSLASLIFYPMDWLPTPPFLTELKWRDDTLFNYALFNSKIKSGLYISFIVLLPILYLFSICMLVLITYIW